MKKVTTQGALSVYADDKPHFSNAQSTSVIVTCSKKNASELAAMLRRLDDLREVFDFDRLILSIDYEADQGFTLNELGKVLKSFPVIPVQVSGPSNEDSSTRLLNGPLAYLYRGGVRYGCVMTLGFDTLVDLPSFACAVRNIDYPPVPCLSLRRTPAVLTSDPENDFWSAPSAESLNEVFRQVSLYVQGRTDDVSCFNILKFACRNAAMVWRFCDLTESGGFDPLTSYPEGHAGLAHICHQLWRHGFSHHTCIQTDNLFWYEEPRFSAGNPDDHMAILQAEQASVLDILKIYRLKPLKLYSDFNF